VSISDNLSGEPEDPEEPAHDDDWDEDEDTVKVHYDLSTWRLDQRSEATEAFAVAGVPHRWDDDELVVPESSEAAADELFTRLEEDIGPFAVALDDDAESTEYGLDEWPESDRETLRRAVTEATIAHRWEGKTIVVDQDREEEVDRILDAIEAGELGEPSGAGAPDNVLGDLFATADRLAKDPVDIAGQDEVTALADLMDEGEPPYGVKPSTWRQIVTSVDELVALVSDPDPDSSDVIGAAQALRTHVRPFV
jgi:hypothetical protein